jgi:hypothetical protein
MKTILSALALLATSSAARAADISAINCVANNGVTISGEAKDGSPFTVTSTWGFYTKDFSVSQIDATAADKITVSLVSKDGPSYVLSLTKEAALKALDKTPVTQELSGTILQLSDDKAVTPTIVAYVRCDLRLR